MKGRARILALLLVLAVAITYYFLNYTPGVWTWMQTLGIALMVAGFALLLLAHIQLGDSFSVSAQAHTLVTHGLYSKIRNPIYVFGSIGIAGAVLFAGRPALLLLFVVLIPLQIIRSRNEARVLEEKFGQQYRDYRRRTWI